VELRNFIKDSIVDV